MQVMREQWTDDRLDGFEANVEMRFDGVDQRFDAVNQRFEAVDQRFDAVDQRFDSVERRIGALEMDMREFRGEMSSRFTSLEHTLIRLGGGLVIAMIGLVGVVIGTLAG